METAVVEAIEESVEPARRTINITKHFAERWAERILEVGKEILDKKERKKAIIEYARLNFNMIKEHANTTFQYAEFIWSGQLYDNISCNYYIEDDMIIVTNTQVDAMITVYKVDFGFPGLGNREARRSLVEEIHRLSKEKEDADFQVLMEMEKKQQELEVLNENIRIMTQQLANLREHKVFVESEVKNLNRKSNHLEFEIQRFTNMLVNSKEYREDMEILKQP